MDSESKSKDGKIIEVHKELIEILETLRKVVNDFSYGALNKTLSYKELTHLLAKKLKLRKFNYLADS